MTSGVDTAEVQEVRRVLLSLGYQNPSAEDIALTLQHVKEARRHEAKQQQMQESFTPVKRSENLRQASASPPHGANDVTLVPHDNGKEEAESHGRDPRPTSMSQKQWPGLSSHSIRGGRTTPMNSTETGRHPGHERAVGRQSFREPRHQKPYYHAGSVVVEGEPMHSMREPRQGRRRIDPSESFYANSKNPAVRNETVVIPTALGMTKGVGSGAPYYVSASEYLNPQARLERHMKRYEKGLKSLYMNKYSDDEHYDERDEGGYYEEDEEDDEYDEEQCTELDANEDRNRNLAMCYDGYSNRRATPEMPLRPSRVLLNQRIANTIYNFTGDIRYKYRGGLGAPLCAVLGPNGSTLRHRSDPVRRGQQMREMWKKDKFLTQEGRKEDRWRVRQSMLAWDPQ